MTIDTTMLERYGKVTSHLVSPNSDMFDKVERNECPNCGIPNCLGIVSQVKYNSDPPETHTIRRCYVCESYWLLATKDEAHDD